MSQTNEPNGLVANVRAAEARDIPRIRELIEPYVDAAIILERTLDELSELLPAFVVAEAADGHVIGCAALEIYSKKMAEIRSLAVQADYQGKGVGKKLIQACIQRAKENNIREVMAITSSETIFQACGFDFILPGEKKALFYCFD